MSVWPLRRRWGVAGRIAVALLGTLLASPKFAQAPQEFIGGAGATRCEKWLETRQQRESSILGFGLAGWVLGFMSGVNTGEQVNGYLEKVSEGDVYSRVDFYCREHPSDILFQAA